MSMSICVFRRMKIVTCTGTTPFRSLQLNIICQHHRRFFSCLFSRHDEYVLSRYKPKYSPAVFHTTLDIPSSQTQQFGVALDRYKVLVMIYFKVE